MSQLKTSSSCTRERGPSRPEDSNGTAPPAVEVEPRVTADTSTVSTEATWTRAGSQGTPVRWKDGIQLRTLTQERWILRHMPGRMGTGVGCSSSQRVVPAKPHHYRQRAAHRPSARNRE
jgi:hypothetical protein